MTRRELLEHQREDCIKTIHEIMRSGQSVTIEGMRRDLPALEKVRAMLNDIENEIAAIDRQSRNAARSRIRVVVPI